MFNIKVLLNIHEFFGSIRCLFVLLLVLSVVVQTSGAVPNLTVSLSSFKEQVTLADPNQERPVLLAAKQGVSFDPLILRLGINNPSGRELSVLWPEFPARTLVPLFQKTSDGKIIPPQVKWSAGLIEDSIRIPPGGTYEVLLYLEELFPLGIPPGTYNIRLKYTPDYKTWVQTNSVFLQITPISNEHKKQFEEVIAILQGGIEYKAKRANRFLARVPNSPFCNILRLEAARSQMVLRNFESASNTLDLVIGDQKSTTFQKNQAYWRKGHLLKKAGKLEEAIKCIEKSQLRTAYRDAMQWKTEREFSKKKEE